ncbi:MAG: EF-hand domain-containing protein [Pseudomonadota bacterium]
MTKHILSAAAVLFIGAGAAFAVAEFDSDGDGMLSYAEMLAAMPTITEDTFAAVDTNGDGMVDEAELVAAQESGLVPAAG